MTLLEFLEARIAEDEAFAMVALPYMDAFEEEPEDPPMPLDEHINNWNPRRVLRECSAKRGLIGLRRGMPGHPTVSQYIDEALGLIAASYGDHPDYKQEWDNR